VGICICFCNQLLFWDCRSPPPPPPSHDPNSKRNPQKSQRRIELMKSTFAQIFLRSLCKCSPNLCKSARGRIGRACDRATGEDDEEEEKKKPSCVGDLMPPSAPGGSGSPGFSSGSDKQKEAAILFYFILFYLFSAKVSDQSWPVIESWLGY
jgi:hypothetical protein